ncbi:MAG: hypothetical protein HYR85_09985 [Planctomycetes bacterium]|nr:hypothetical protein [Planctomycetota bacterium]MBI3846641.1 hypothetical protein [Planctomycetota bacterium]
MPTHLLARLVAFARNAVRRSPWLVISISVHVVVIAGLSIVYMHRNVMASDSGGRIDCFLRHTDPPSDVELPPEPEPLIDRTAIPTDAQGEVAPDTITDPFPLPPSNDPPDYTKDVGTPNDLPPSLNPLGHALSPTMGTGVGGGPRGRGPGVFPGRGDGHGGPDSGRTPNGDIVKTHAAVLEGLRWLIRHQGKDGSWGVASLHECCDAGRPCAGSDDELSSRTDEGVTALAILAFLGAGFSNQSKLVIVDTVRGKPHVAGEVVSNGLRWLTKRQKPDGSFTAEGPFLYNEALATMALAEAYGLTGNRMLHDSAQKAVDFLVAAQKPSPKGDGRWGWRYLPRQAIEAGRTETTDAARYAKDLHDADTSVTGWVVMALKSAELCGLTVPRESFDGALAFTRFATAGDGLVGYLDADGAGGTVSGTHDEFDYHFTTMSALGVCIRAFVEHDPEDPFFDLAAKQLVKDLPTVSGNKQSIDYYYWYYGTLALNQLDGPDSPRRSGKYWDRWNRALQSSLLALQEGEKNCGRGAWLVGDRWSATGGPVYATAINVLTLEVYYRYENAFAGTKRPRRR